MIQIRLFCTIYNKLLRTDANELLTESDYRKQLIAQPITVRASRDAMVGNNSNIATRGGRHHYIDCKWTCALTLVTSEQRCLDVNEQQKQQVP